MIALDPAGPQLKQLTRYLKDANAELQMGAVSGLGDIDDPQATKLLAATLPDLTPANRTLAIDALLRSEERVKVLRGLLDNGKLAKDSLSATQRQKLEAADR
jgi:HEAT repeat protein